MSGESQPLPAEDTKLAIGVQPPGFDPVTYEALDEIVQRIVSQLQPKRIILFGSYGYGWPTENEEDYALARSALRRKKPLVYGAVFHAQQCAEKYLKALLVAQGQELPKTHDLAALSDLCGQSNVIIPVDQDALQRLAAYAVQVRYPGEDPTVEEARLALETPQAVRRYARSLLGIAA